MDLETLRQLCLELPGVTEDVKWGSDLCFCIGGKMFLITGLDRAVTGASFKVPESEFAEMIARDGFRPAAYLGRYHWVCVEELALWNKVEWRHVISQSYELVKAKLPAKIRNGLDASFQRET